MKKIVFFLNDWNPALGYQDNILIKELLDQGNEVQIILGRGRSLSPQLNIEAYGDKLSIIELPYIFQINDGFYSLRGISKILKKSNPDIIIALDGQFDHLHIAKYVKNNSKCKFFLKCHCDDSNSNLRLISKYIIYPFIRRPIFYIASKFIQKILIVTPKTGDFMEKVYKANKDSMKLFPVLPKFRFNKESKIKYKDKIRKELNIEHDAFVIFTGGTLTPLKKTDILLESLDLISDKNIHIIICGRHSNDSKDYTSNLDMLMSSNQNIHFLSWVEHDKISNYLYASDISIFCAGQSSLWQDSMSLGLPLIVGSGTKISEQDPAYLNKYNSVKILSRDDINPNLLKKNILDIYYDKNLLKLMGEGSLKYYKKYLDPKKLVNVITNG